MACVILHTFQRARNEGRSASFIEHAVNAGDQRKADIAPGSAIVQSGCVMAASSE